MISGRSLFHLIMARAEKSLTIVEARWTSFKLTMRHQSEESKILWGTYGEKQSQRYADPWLYRTLKVSTITDPEYKCSIS